MVEKLKIAPFLDGEGPLYDVRSPGEYLKGHIPGAISLPLFTNEERALVGTCYKLKGHEEAFTLGLELVGPKMASFARAALKGGKKARVYCWRGGMRSSSMGWLFETAGIKTTTLHGGYKAFRNFVLKTLESPYKFRVIAGYTGSGKTEYLQKLAADGKQVIDLESLANHRGSAFGHLGQKSARSNEHFENLIGEMLRGYDLESEIFIEDESRMIGPCKVPDALFCKMKEGERVWLEASLEERVERLAREYGEFSRDELIEAVKKIEKRLGGARMQEACLRIREGDMREAVKVLLSYYDRAYGGKGR